MSLGRKRPEEGICDASHRNNLALQCSKGKRIADMGAMRSERRIAEKTITVCKSMRYAKNPASRPAKLGTPAGTGKCLRHVALRQTGVARVDPRALPRYKKGGRP